MPAPSAIYCITLFMLLTVVHELLTRAVGARNAGIAYIGIVLAVLQTLLISARLLHATANPRKHRSIC